MALDLDLVDQVINRPHVIDLREDGWTIMHPPACHPNLFDCSVNRAASEQIDGPLDFQGRYYCGLDDFGMFYVGDTADHAQGIDWNDLVAELRAAREVVKTTRGHDCATRWQEPCTHQRAALTAYDKVAEVRDGR